MISVIIATYNRAEALRTIALPSLLDQKDFTGKAFADYEVIIWDASPNDHAHRVVEKFLPNYAERSIELRWFRAPRQGSASQRNDALRQTSGKIIAFFDDDSQVSPDGLVALDEVFSDNPTVMGASLRLTDEFGELRETRQRRFWRQMRGHRPVRRFRIDGGTPGFGADPPGPAEWLSGCSMAFRREVFQRLVFDERLERFAPYALAEDSLLSHSVAILWGNSLIVTDRGWVWHRPDTKPRAATTASLSMTFYNRILLWRQFAGPLKLSFPLLASALFFKTIKLTRRYGWDNVHRAWKEVRTALRVPRTPTIPPLVEEIHHRLHGGKI